MKGIIIGLSLLFSLVKSEDTTEKCWSEPKYPWYVKFL